MTSTTSSRSRWRPFRPNSAVIFLRTPKSYHGVEPISEEQGSLSERYVLQYMLIHKY